MVATLVGNQKKHLAFHARGDSSPSLFIAVNGLQGRAQQLGYFFLGFFQIFPEPGEFFIVHAVSRLFAVAGVPDISNMVYRSIRRSIMLSTANITTL